MRTQPAGLRTTHRRPYAKRLCLVAGRKNNARTHDDRTTEKSGVVSLFDRGVKSVEIGMEDRGLELHEHIFV